MGVGVMHNFSMLCVQDSLVRVGMSCVWEKLRNEVLSVASFI